MGPRARCSPGGQGGRSRCASKRAFRRDEAEPDARVERLYRAQAQHGSNGQRPKARLEKRTSQPAHEHRGCRGRGSLCMECKGYADMKAHTSELELFAFLVRDGHGFGDASVPAQRRGSATTTDWSRSPQEGPPESGGGGDAPSPPAARSWPRGRMAGSVMLGRADGECSGRRGSCTGSRSLRGQRRHISATGACDCL